MKLSEMAEALGNIGFKEVPTKRFPHPSEDDRVDYKGIVTCPEIHRHLLDSGELKGTSVFLNTMFNRVYYLSIVLPDTIQNMYWNAINNLEDVLEMPYHRNDNARAYSRYASSCSEEYKKLFSAFCNLLDEVEITPEEVSGGYLKRPFELNISTLEAQNENVNLKNNYVLELIQDPRNNLDETFYKNYLTQLPNKLRRLNDFEKDWIEFVDEVCDSGETLRHFYENVGLNFKMNVNRGAVISNLKNIHKRISECECDSQLYNFAIDIAKTLGPEDKYHHDLIDSETFYAVAKELSSQHPEIDNFNLLIPKIAKFTGGTEFGMGVTYRSNIMAAPKQ